MVVHTRFTPVFVVGAARSGTTLVVDLLKKYLGVSFGTESQFIIRYLDRLPYYEPLSERGNLVRLVADLAGERFFERTRRRFGFELDQRRVIEATAEPTYAGVLSVIFGMLAAHQGFTRWGDKTPEYVERLPSLLQLYPAAQFVHVLRDGRDVTLSAMQMHFGPKNAYKGALDWQRVVRAVDRFKSIVPASQFVEVRYETLLDDPVGTVRALIPFLGIADTRGELEARLRRELGDDIRQANRQKWRTAFSRRQMALFESVAGAELAASGYERLFSPAPSPGLMARGFWTVDHQVRQMLRADHRRDMWYRLRVKGEGFRLKLRSRLRT